MRYSNPPLPTGHVAQDETRELMFLLSVVAAILALLIGAAVLLGGWLAPMIPFAAERSLLASAEQRFERAGEAAPEAEQVQRELAVLVERLSAVMALPEGMTITVHYVDSPTVNAMATLGGHLIVFRGLVEKLETEEALAAVLAHEIGHVRERHVIRAMGRGVAVVTTLRAIGINSRGLSQWAIGQTGEMTALTFSRDAEREADRAAVEAASRLYGHLGGVISLFEFFTSQGDGGLEILKTHPLPANRLAEIRALAEARGYPTEGEQHPLSPALAVLAGPVPPQTP